MAGVNVLVTGAGTLLGQGILRCLRLSGRGGLRIVTADPSPHAAGHWLGHRSVTIPVASDPGYVERIGDVLAQEAVDLVFVGTDIELPLFAAARADLMARTAARVVVSSPDVVEIADDKWATARFLEQSGFPFARSALATDPTEVERLVREVGVPLFAKPRRGARSEGARVVASAAEVRALCAGEPGLVVQELLPAADGEFTAGCLVSNGQCPGAVVLRRDLRAGNTARAEWHPRYQRFEPTIVAIAERLGAEGPVNLQFRVRDGAPVVFEINARFSGTTPIRAIFGFNEVEALLDHLVDGVPLPTARLRPGLVIRTTSDMFVAPDELQRRAPGSPVDTPRSEYFPFPVTRP